MRRNKLATVAIAALAVTAFAACGDDDDDNNLEDPLDTVVDDVEDDLDDTATTLAVPGT